MDGTPQVQAWTRITADVPLTIAYTLGAAARTYVPDFIAIDAEGVCWVVEAKSDRDMADETVLAKRDAAVEWVGAVNASDAVQQRWGYVLASESAIGNASDWRTLLAASFNRK